MKKLFSIALALVLLITLTGCGGEKEKPGTQSNVQSESVTLASMKKAARDADYAVDDMTYLSPENSIGGFTVVFTFNGTDAHIPVVEFEDKAAADAYAEYLNAGGYRVAIVNGTFLTMASAHNGIVDHEEEKAFLENLINGRSLDGQPE